MRATTFTVLIWALALTPAGCDGSFGLAGGGAGADPDAEAPREGGPARDAGLPDAAALLDASGLHDAASEPTDAAIEEPDADPGVFRLEDALRDGTVGNPIGGAFGPEGWTTTDRTDRIWYALPRLVEGSIEITVSNVTTETLLPTDNEILTMYEAGWGIEEPIRYSPEYRNNHYKCMIRIYGSAEADRVGQQKMMWGMCPSGAPGYDACGCGSFFEEPFGGEGNWDGTPQRLRIEWADGISRLLRNGVEAVSIDWSGSGLSFGPQELHFTIGSPRSVAMDGTGMPVGAVFSDLVVEGRIGEPATCP